MTYGRWHAPFLIALLMLALSACGRITFDETPLATLSRGQISFGSLSFASASNLDYTTVTPSAAGVARGLGSDTYSLELGVGGDLVFACVNNGSNEPQGVMNYPLGAVVATTGLTATERNGRAAFDVDADPGAVLWDALLAELLAESGLGVSDFCPNPNYTLDALGFRYQSVSVSLNDPDGSLADSLVFTCSDPVHPSGETCTAAESKKGQ
ncbi:MAG: hypothetical protein R6W77_10485 [Trueperaceae bacterium]